MSDPLDSTKIIRDISLLYELSLSVGKSLDLQTNCDNFLKTLMARKNLAYVSVWLKNELLADQREPEGMTLIYANPEFRIRERHLPPGHPMLARPAAREAFSVASSDRDFPGLITEKGISNGAFAIIPLGEIGLLKLFSLAKKAPFEQQELSQLRDVVAKFTTSLEGCLAHRRVIRVIADRRRAEASLKTYTDKLKQSNRDLAKRNRQLLALQSAGAAIASSLDLQSVLETVTQEMANLLQVPACAISEWNRAADTITLVAEHGPDERWGVGSSQTIFHLADYPPTKQVLVERRIEQMIISQPDIDPGERQYMLESGIKTQLLLPMVHQDRVVGLVEIMDNQIERTFTAQELALAQLLANQAASAIENARLYAETQRRLSEQIALREAGAVISSTLDLKAVLNSLTEQLVRIVEATSAYINDYDPEAKTSTVLAEYFSPHACPQERVSDLGVTYHLTRDFPADIAFLQARQPDINHIDDPEVNESERAHMAQYGAKTVLSIPLQIGGQTVAHVEVWESRRRREFTPEEVALCQGVAQQAAIAIENARLYRQAQQEIAERRRAEKALKTYAAKLERSNRELQEFAYIASHDLQEPLRKVQAFGSRLQARCAGRLDERGQDYIARMQNAAARMQNLIDGLLAYSRVTTQAQPFEPVDLAQAAREVVSDLEIQIEQVGGRVEVGQLPALEADPTQMQQLFQNLIGSALKFHRQDEAPLVIVQARFLNEQGDRLTEDSSGAEMCQIMVVDNGIGFDQKYAERIFQVFQRLHGRSKYEGTGVGLATCRKIAERHGGSISASSAPGQGATFTVTLPVRQRIGENGR